MLKIWEETYKNVCKMPGMIFIFASRERERENRTERMLLLNWDKVDK